MYRDKREYILKNHVYVQILIYNFSNFIKEYIFFQVIGNISEINLSEKCVNVSCCIELISDMSKI